MMTLTWEILTVHTTVPFVIARGGTTEHRTLKVVLRDEDGVEGWGEAAPNRFYGETPETAVAALERLRPIVESSDPFAVERLEQLMNAELRNNGSVKSAVSAAAHDLVGKRLGVPLWKLWGLAPRDAPVSSFTIAIAPDLAQLKERVRAAAEYPVLKIKLGTDRDAEIIRTVREAAPEKVIRVDANAAWTPKAALKRIDLLAALGVESVEQPVAAADLEGLRFIRARSRLPIIADESCVTLADVPRLAGAVDGINIKLSKCGGLREALRMIATARAHGMLVMAGCMIETSLGITAAAHLAPLLDYADFDGAALLADDPFIGASIAGGNIALPTGPGLGVRVRA
jgi:L-alanine-DL-glutamate epimerase-like enolase superfamily enzyme